MLCFTIDCRLVICVRLLRPTIGRPVICVRLLWPTKGRRLVICVRIVIYYVRIVLIRRGISEVRVWVRIGVAIWIVAIGIGVVREPREPEESTEEEV